MELQVILQTYEDITNSPKQVNLNMARDEQ